MIVFSSVFLLMIAVTSCVAIDENRLINKDVHRVIDISTQLVNIHYNITIENREEIVTSGYLFYLEKGLESALSYIEVNGIDSSFKSPLAVSEIKEGEETIIARQIRFKKPLKPRQIRKIEINAIFTHQLHPYPAQILQGENQFVNYSGNIFFYSFYPTLKQTTTVVCASDVFESFTTLEPTNHYQNLITYGPYENIPPFSFQKLHIHYENNEPFITITNLERVIQISHWGNIAVEETIELVHKGAVLKGPFSRLEFLDNRKKHRHSSVSEFTTVLPASAKDVYYKDEIGNISTSNLKILPDSVEMLVRLRFPLFGGWKIKYTIGYNLPSYEYLYHSGEDYSLKMRLLDHVFDNMVIDEFLVTFILPEYCTDIWIFTPYPTTHLPDKKHYTYLDTVGREVRIRAANNLIDYHVQNFEMQYVFDKKMMFVEPFIIIFAFYFVLVIIIIVVRLDFSITPEESCGTKRQEVNPVQKKNYEIKPHEPPANHKKHKKKQY